MRIKHCCVAPHPTGRPRLLPGAGSPADPRRPGRRAATFTSGEARLVESPTELGLYDGEGTWSSAFDLEDLGSLVIAPLKAAHLFGSPVSSGVTRLGTIRRRRSIRVTPSSA
jgi:hypothetical protein